MRKLLIIQFYSIPRLPCFLILILVCLLSCTKNIKSTNILKYYGDVNYQYSDDNQRRELNSLNGHVKTLKTTKYYIDITKEAYKQTPDTSYTHFTTILKFDSSGRILYKYKYDKFQDEYKRWYSDYAKEIIKKEIVPDDKDSIVTEFIYNDNNILIGRKTNYREYTFPITYNGDTMIIEGHYGTRNYVLNKLDSKVSISGSTTYEYHENGNIKLVNRYDRNSNLFRQTHFDTNKYILKRIEYSHSLNRKNKEHNISSITLHNYNKQIPQIPNDFNTSTDTVFYNIYYLDYRLLDTPAFTNKYDKRGVLYQRIYKDDSSYAVEFKYVTDRYKNWIERIEISNGRVLAKEKREIEYF